MLFFNFQIEVYCDWLIPQHVAKLPLVVYEPLTFVVMEQAAGDHAYLHMTLTNTCTLPMAVRSPTLLSDKISLTQLHGELPKVFTSICLLKGNLVVYNMVYLFCHTYTYCDA